MSNSLKANIGVRIILSLFVLFLIFQIVFGHWLQLIVIALLFAVDYILVQKVKQEDVRHYKE